MAAEPAFAWSDWAIPPGDYLIDTLEALGMSQAELAVRTDRPSQVISEIVRGKKSITPDTALEFERVLGVPAHIWLGLENEYQLTLARLRAREALESEVPMLKLFPVKEMRRLGWLAPSDPRDQAGIVGALQHFFGVATLRAALNDRFVPATALRVSDRAKVKPGALAAWLRRGVLDAAAIETEEFDRSAFELALVSIRGFTSKSPSDFLPEMRRLCADAGVALVLTPELPGTGANGSMRWLGGSKALIQLNLRNKWADIFWFTFFHEARHVLQHKVSQVFVDLEERVVSPDEADADAFAADHLIPPASWRYFCAKDSTRQKDIEEFALKLGIHPGIVVGRAQREIWKRYNLNNDLRQRYQWADE